MKKTVISAFCALLALLCACARPHAPGAAVSPARGEGRFENAKETDAGHVEPADEKEKRKAMNYKDLKGVWVSQFDMQHVYKKDGAQREKAEYVTIVRRMVSDIAALGFNTVFLQVRPYGDSFYPSAYYPDSSYVTGKYGRRSKYDPVEIFIEEAHAKSLSVQAWINPMRLMTEKEIVLIPDDAPLKQMYYTGELVNVEGRLYLDPAREDAIKLIAGGASEALSTHAFDGLHIDDYFYPTQDESFDKATFASSRESSLAEFRINNIDRLVKTLYDTAKSVDEKLIFGVSPAGNLSSVVKKYSADVYKWCSQSGYADYILPQLYFGLEHGVCPFAEEAEKWAAAVRSPDVALYIGMTLGKAVAGSAGEEDKWAATEAGRREWIDHTDVLARCMRFLAEWGKADGFSFFSLQYFTDPVTGEPNAAAAEEAAGIYEYIKGA